MSPLRAALASAYEFLVVFLAVAAAAMLGALPVLISADVVLRNLGLGSLPWIVEVSEYAIFWATFLAAPWVLHEGAHVRVDIALAASPPALRRALELLADAAGLAVSLVLGTYGLFATLDSWRMESLVFKALVVAEWWLLAVIPLSAALMAVEFALRLARLRRAAPEAPLSEGF